MAASMYNIYPFLLPCSDYTSQVNKAIFSSVIHSVWED